MALNLEEYNKKRNFESTGEPVGEVSPPGDGLRFVVQRHMARTEHYDFRLEWDGVLLSWAVPRGPSFDTRDKRLAVMVEPHPLDYRNFEGTIPRGEYGGGEVMLWDEGFWEPYGDTEEALSKGSLKFALKGRRLRGSWALVRLRSKEGGNKNNWLLIKEKDEFAKEGVDISGFDTSIRTGRTMEEIRNGEDEKLAKNPFNETGVQLAKLSDTIPEGDDWLFELKYDGYRIVAFIEGNGVHLMTRNGGDYTGRFQPVASSLVDFAAGRAMVLDGEMTVTDSQGKTDFQALQNYLRNPEGRNLTYIVFDLLALDGVDLRSRPLFERKAILEELMKDGPKNLSYSVHVCGNGQQSFKAACELGMEGIVGKKSGSVYSGTRNGDWIKLKCDKRQEFVIGGYTLSGKKASGISSLLLGVYQGGELAFVGRAGTGLGERSVKELQAKFEDIKTPLCPFSQEPKIRPGEKVTWLEPCLVAEIKFAEWTQDNLLRQASFKGLREDKQPRDIQREASSDMPTSSEERIMDPKSEGPVIEGIKISSPGKIIFEEPNITKEDVVRYYEAAAQRMLPYVSRRLLSIVRCPKGIAQTCFYKKHPGPGSKCIVTIQVPGSGGENEEYFYIEDKPGLIYEAQMGTLEFHTWGSRIDELEKPDIMVFDLDPDEGMELNTVRQGVRDIKSVLSDLSLVSYLKTSGGKGYHVVVPFKPAASWEVFRDFARRVAEFMEQKWPDRYTSNVRKSRRTNKIFIDWIRNGRGATSIAPYSLRARKGARVSMPISWDELDSVSPDGITMEAALERIKGGDPWKDFFITDQQLK